MSTSSFAASILPAVLAFGTIAPATAQTLERFASLPADTFAPGPTSGQFITTTNGRVPPFVDLQPVQGISSVVRTGRGDYLTRRPDALSDARGSADD